MLTDQPVPGNRWDLLDLRHAPAPRVSVVITHYEQHRLLAATWAALAAQTHPPAEIVISDDGSAVTPVAPPGGPPTSVRTQPDRGFRAAAARNRGVAATTGEVLVFLDADTVPEPGFLAALTAGVACCPDVLAVGRRRHADLSALAPGRDPAAAPRLSEPDWLRAGYAATRDLLDADGSSFRFVISAVLACRRTLFDDLGGFDERFVGYGGEDWDLAYRAWNNGAVLQHVPDAVAWHDGPDWGGRADPDADADKTDREGRRLAALVPEPGVRGVWRPDPDDPGGLADLLVDLPATVPDPRAVIGAGPRDDVAVRRPDDPPWTRDQLRRARATATARVHRPVPPGALATALERLVGDDLAAVSVRADGRELAQLRSTRAAGRARRWAATRSRADVDAEFGTAVIDIR